MRTLEPDDAKDTAFCSFHGRLEPIKQYGKPEATGRSGVVESRVSLDCSVGSTTRVVTTSRRIAAFAP